MSAYHHVLGLVMNDLISVFTTLLERNCAQFHRWANLAPRELKVSKWQNLEFIHFWPWNQCSFQWMLNPWAVLSSYLKKFKGAQETLNNIGYYCLCTCCPPSLKGRTLLLKTPFTLVTWLREIMLMLNKKPPPQWPTFIVPQLGKQAARRRKVLPSCELHKPQ